MTLFTKDQLKQLEQLIQPLSQGIQDLRTGQDELRSDVAVLKVGQEDLRTGQDELRSDVAVLKVGQEDLRAKYYDQVFEIQAHTKTLKYIKNKLNKTSRTVDIIGRMYNQDIMDNRKRIKRLEEEVGIASFQH